MYRIKYPNCRECGALIDFSNPKSRREHNHRRTGYCNYECKKQHNGCLALSCFDTATDGRFCWRHRLSEAIRQTQRQIKKANNWCKAQNCTLENLPKELPFDTGWPDDPHLCREIKTKCDWIRWEQIIRFAWIKQYYQREVKIVLIESSRKGVQGEGIVFNRWPDYVQHLVATYKALPRFKPQTSEAPTIEESKKRSSFRIEPVFYPKLENFYGQGLFLRA